ncbi:glycosyltransferase [Nitrosomonas mobilis]|uniref:Putative Glycosyl transferase n=1 Tax=Nitrosomonas mobilis TaxID=51642 RepID=A0A1G5SDG5_9PROT|nr:glycosyltransferase [Nitrosomonas mobilis]SCZ85246.1 putative Glycosyl transferase [Nitrosomonas mobilis]
MHVIHLNSYYKTNLIHREYILALSKLGVQQIVFVPVEKKVASTKQVVEDVNGARVFYVPCFRSWYRYVWPFKMLIIWRALLVFLKGNRPDFIHAHTAVSNGLLAFFVRKIYDVPYLVTVRNTDTDFFFRKSFFFRWVGRFVLRNASAIMVLSPVYRDQQFPRYFSEVFLKEILKRVHVIPSAISADWHIEFTSHRSEPIRRVAFVGRIDRNKNLRLLIDAARLLGAKKRPIELHVVGDGDDRPYCENYAKGINIKFHGIITDNYFLRTILRSCDLLAMPSFRETLGVVYLEAMSQGLPVIYTKGQGFDGIYEEGCVGYSVDPSSPKDLARKIELIYKNYTRVSESALNASKDYSWDLVGGRVFKLYSEIVCSKF